MSLPDDIGVCVGDLVDMNSDIVTHRGSVEWCYLLTCVYYSAYGGRVGEAQ